MSEKGILKKIDDIFNYCEEIDNHLPKEEQTGYRMLPDIFYIQKEVHKLQQKVEQLEKANEKLKHKLNDIAFGDDSELALRFLRKIDYVDFDEKRKVYINKHNKEPFLWKDEQEKDYYLKDEELNEYTQQLEYKVEQLESTRKEVIEYINNEIFKRTILVGVGTKKYTRNILDNILNILNKGDNNE